MRFSQLFVVLLLAGLALSVPLMAQAQASDHAQEAQNLVEAALNGDTTSVYDRFSDQVKAQITADQFAAGMTGLPEQVGAFQAITGVQADSSGNAITLTVQFEKMVLDAHVAFDADNKVIAFNFAPSTSGAAATEAPTAPAPSYADPSTFTETDVTVGDYKLPGVLTMPNTTELVPAVVMLSGSGPNDRDETVGPNKPFRDIAQGLATQGIATLRFDKRTLAAPQTLDMTTMTVKEEYLDDAQAAIDLVRTAEGVDPNRVFVLGHSEGGYVLPRVVAQAGDKLAGAIYAAALAGSLPDALVRQTQYIVDHTPGVTDAQKQAAVDQMQATVDQITALTPDSPADQMVFHAPPSYWLDLAAYDPVATAESLSLPMLFVQGGRDYQVTVADDLTLWQAALGDRANVTFKEYADLNHLLMTGEGDSVPAEYQVPGNVAQPVIDDIAAWVKAQ